MNGRHRTSLSSPFTSPSNMHCTYVNTDKRLLYQFRIILQKLLFLVGPCIFTWLQVGFRGLYELADYGAVEYSFNRFIFQCPTRSDSFSSPVAFSSALRPHTRCSSPSIQDPVRRAELACPPTKHALAPVPLVNPRSTFANCKTTTISHTRLSIDTGSPDTSSESIGLLQ